MCFSLKPSRKIIRLVMLRKSNAICCIIIGTLLHHLLTLAFVPLLKRDIDTGDSRPIKQSPRRPPFAARDADDQIVDEMLEAGVIEPSNSPWASPVCLDNRKTIPIVFVLITGQ